MKAQLTASELQILVNTSSLSDARQAQPFSFEEKGVAHGNLKLSVIFIFCHLPIMPQFFGVTSTNDRFW
jgi:hypothetical protein